MTELLAPYLGGGEPAAFALPEDALSRLGAYLDLLLRWNARTNLTAIREPEAIVARHFGESLFAARCLRAAAGDARLELSGANLLDFGSGAGFPGIPVQLALPALRVTLAESQGKKASFLREACRELRLESEVYAGRVEEMASARLFDVVTLRAVDNMELALPTARQRVRGGGLLGEFDQASGAGQEFVVPGTQTVFRLTQSTP